MGCICLLDTDEVTACVQALQQRGMVPESAARCSMPVRRLLLPRVLCRCVTVSRFYFIPHAPVLVQMPRHTEVTAFHALVVELQRVAVSGEGSVDAKKATKDIAELLQAPSNMSKLVAATESFLQRLNRSQGGVFGKVPPTDVLAMNLAVALCETVNSPDCDALTGPGSVFMLWVFLRLVE